MLCARANHSYVSTYCRYENIWNLSMRIGKNLSLSFLQFDLVGFVILQFTVTVHVKNLYAYAYFEWNLNNKPTVFYGKKNDKLYHY